MDAVEVHLTRQNAICRRPGVDGSPVDGRRKWVCCWAVPVVYKITYPNAQLRRHRTTLSDPRRDATYPGSGRRGREFEIPPP
jgi:hypothetical protein